MAGLAPRLRGWQIPLIRFCLQRLRRLTHGEFGVSLRVVLVESPIDRYRRDDQAFRLSSRECAFREGPVALRLRESARRRGGAPQDIAGSRSQRAFLSRELREAVRAIHVLRQGLDPDEMFPGVLVVIKTGKPQDAGAVGSRGIGSGFAGQATLETFGLVFGEALRLSKPPATYLESC